MKILVLGALVVLLNLPVSEAHSILRIKEGGKEDTSIISDALGAVEDAFANLKKHQDEMSEHIKDLVVLQDQVGRPEITKGSTATVKRPHKAPKTTKCHPKRKCHRTMIRRFRFKNGKPIIAPPIPLENKIDVNASKTGTVNHKGPANRTHPDQHVVVSNQKQYHKTTDTHDSRQQGGKEIREKEIPVPKAKNIENSRVSNVPAEVDTKKKLTLVSNRAPVSIITPPKVQEGKIDNSRSKGFAPGKGVPSTTTNGPVRISGALSEVVPIKKVVVSSTQRVPPKVSGSNSGKSFIQGDLHKPVTSKNVSGSQIATKLEDVVVPKKLHPNGQHEESSSQADNHPHHSSNKVDKNGTHHQPTPNAPSNGKTANQPQAAIIKKQDMSYKLATVPTKALSDHHEPPSSLNASTSPNTNKKTTQSSAPNSKISLSRLGNNIPKITDTDTAPVSRVPDSLNTKVALDQKKLKEVGNSGLKQNLTNAKDIVKSPTSYIGEQNGKQIAGIHNPLVQSVLNSNQFDSKEHIAVGTLKHPSGGAATDGHNSNQHRITEKLQHPDSSITHTSEKPERKPSRLSHTESDRSMKNKPIGLNQPPTVESVFPGKITKPFLGEGQVPKAFKGAEVALNGADARAGGSRQHGNGDTRYQSSNVPDLSHNPYNQALNVKTDKFSENRARPGSLDITTSPKTTHGTVPNSNIGQSRIDDNISKIADTAFVGPVADQLNTQASFVHKKLKDVGGSHLKEHFAAGKAGAVDDVKLPTNNLGEQKGKHVTSDYSPPFESVLNPINYEPSTIATPAVEPFNVKDAVSEVVDNTDHFPLGSTKYVSGGTIGDGQLSDYPKKGNIKNTNSMKDNPERQDTNPSTLEHDLSTETKPNRFSEQTTGENNFPDTSNIHLIPDKFGKKPVQKMLEHGSHVVTPDSRQLEDSTKGVYISKGIDLPANVRSRPHSLSSTSHSSIGSDTPTHLNGAQEQRISDKNELTPNSKDADIAAAEIGNSEDPNYDPSIQDSNVGPGQSGEMEPDEFNESSEEAEEKGTLRGSSFDEEKSPYQKKSGGDGGSHVPIALAKEEDIFSTKVDIPTPNIQPKLYDTIASDMRTVKTGVSMEPIELNDSVIEKNTHPETNTLEKISLEQNHLVRDDISTAEHKDLINKSDNVTDNDRPYAKLHDNTKTAAKQSIHSKESIAHDDSTGSGDAAVADEDERTNMKHQGDAHTSRKPGSQTISDSTPRPNPFIGLDESNDSDASMNTYPDTIHKNFNPNNYTQIAPSDQRHLEHSSHAIQEDIVRPRDYATEDLTSKKLDIPDYTNTPALNRKLDKARIPYVFNSKESTNVNHQGVTDTSREPESQTVSAFTPKSSPSIEIDSDELKDSAASINTYPDTIHTNFNPENYTQLAPSYQNQQEDGSDAIQEDIVRPTDHTSKNLDIPYYTNTPALNSKLDDARIPDVFNSKESTNMKHQGVADTSRKPESQTISASTPKPNPSIRMDLDEFKSSAASINTYPHTIHTNYFNPDNYTVENGSDGIIRPTEHAHKLYDPIASDIPTSKQLLGDARHGVFKSEESTLAGESDRAHDHSMNQQENEGIRDEDSSISHKLDKAENQPRSHLIPDGDESIKAEPNNHASQTQGSSTKTIPSGQDSKSSPVSNSKHNGLLKPSLETENEDLDGDTNTPGDIDDISEEQDTVDHTHSPQPKKHPTLDSSGESILHELDNSEKQPTSDLIADDESIEMGPTRLNKPVVEENGAIIPTTSHVPQTPGSSTKTVPSGQDSKSSPVSNSKHNGLLKPSLKTENDDLDGDTNTPGDIDDISEEQDIVDHTHLPQPKRHPIMDSADQSILHKLDKPEKQPTSDLIADDESIETRPTRLNKPVVEEKGAIISTTSHVPQTPGSSTKAVPSGQDSKSSPVNNPKHNGLLKPSLKTENEGLDVDTNTPGDIDDISEEQDTVDHTHLPQPKKHPTLDSAGQSILHKLDKPEKQPTSDLIADDESIETGPTRLNKPVVEEKDAIISTTSHVPQTPGNATKTVPSGQGSNGSPVHNGLLKPSHDTTENGVAAHNSAYAEADKDFLDQHEDASTMGQSIDNTSGKSRSESSSTSTTEPDPSVGIGVSKFNKPASESAHPSAGHVDSPDQAGLEGSTGGSSGNAIHRGLSNDIAEEQDIVDRTHLPQPKKNPTLDSVSQIISHKLNEPGSQPASDLIPKVDESIETEPIRINEPVAEENGATVSDTSHIPQTPGSFKKTSLNQDSNGSPVHNDLLKPSIKMENGDGGSSVRKELEDNTDGSPSNTEGLADDSSEEQDTIDHAHLPQRKKNPTLDSVGQSISHKFYKSARPSHDFIPEVDESIEMEPIRVNKPVAEEKSAIPQTPGSSTNTVLSIQGTSNRSPVNNGLLKPSLRMENEDIDRGTDTSGHTHIHLNPIIHDTAENGHNAEANEDLLDQHEDTSIMGQNIEDTSGKSGSEFSSTYTTEPDLSAGIGLSRFNKPASESAHPRAGHVDSPDQTELEGSTGGSASKAIHRGLEDDIAEGYDIVDHNRLAQLKKNPSPDLGGQSIPHKLNVPESQPTSDRIPEDDESIETEPVRLNYPVAKEKGGIIPTTSHKSVQDSNSNPVSDSQHNGLLKPSLNTEDEDLDRDIDTLEKNPTLDSSVLSDSNSAEQFFGKTQISNAKKSALDSVKAHATHAGKADKYLLERQESPTSKDRTSSVVLDSSRNQTVTPKIDPPSSSIRTGLTTTSNPKLYDDIASNIPNVRTHGAGAIETVENLPDEHENENIKDQNSSIANTYTPNIHSSSDFTTEPDLSVETEPFGPYDPVAEIGGTNLDKSHIRFVPENSMEAHPSGQQQLPDTNGRPASDSVHAGLQRPSNNIKNGDLDKGRDTPIVLNPIVHDIFENGGTNAEADEEVIDQQDDASVKHQSTPKIPSKSRNETSDASSSEPNVHIGIKPTRPKKPDAASAHRRTGHVDFVPDGFDETILPDQEVDSSTGPTSNAINEGLTDNITEDDVNEEHDIVDHALTKAAEKSFDKTQTSNADNSRKSAQDNINMHSTSNVKADKDLLEQHGSATKGDKSSGMTHTSNESKNQVLNAHNHKASPGSNLARTGLTTTEDHTPNHELFVTISNDIPGMKQLQRLDKAGAPNMFDDRESSPTDVSTDGIGEVIDKHLPDEHQDESTEDHGRSQTFSNIAPEPDVSAETYPIELDNAAAIKEGANLNKSHIRLAPENSKQAEFLDQGQIEDSNASPARESVRTDLRKPSNNTNDYLDRDKGTSYTSGSQISSASTSKPAAGSVYPITNQVGHPPDTVKDIESQDQQGKELEDVSNVIHRGHLQLVDNNAEDDVNKEHTSPIMEIPALDETIIGATSAAKKFFDKTQIITNAYNSKGSVLDGFDDATDAVEADKHIQDNNGSHARDSVHAGPLRPLVNMENDLDKDSDILAHTYRPPSTLNPIQHDNTENDGTAHDTDSEEGEYSLNQHKDASINGQSIAHPTSKSRSETSRPNLSAEAGLTELTKAAAESTKPKSSNPGFVPDNFNRIISPIQEDLEDDRGGSASNTVPRYPEHNIDEDQGIVNHTPLTKNPTLVKSITGTKDAAEKAFDKTPILKAYNSKSALDDDSTVDADGVEADEYVLDKPRTQTLNVPNAKSDSARPVDNTTESGLSRKLDVSSHKDSSNDSISSGTPSMKQLQLLDDEETVPSIINNRVSSPSDTSKNADEDTARKGTIGHMHFSPESSIKTASSEKIQKQENNGSISDGDFDHQRPSINVEKDNLDKVSDTHRLSSIMNSSRHDTTHINAGEYDTDEDQHENASIKGQSMADTSGESRSKTSVGISLTKSTEPAPESAHLRYIPLGIVSDNFNERVSPDNPKPEHDNRGSNDDEANQYFLDQHENASIKGQSVADTSDESRSETSSASAYEPKLSVGLTKSTISAPESAHSRSSHLTIIPNNFNENVSSDKPKPEEDSRGPDDDGMQSGFKKLAENVTEDNVNKQQDTADDSDISSLPESPPLDKADERSAETFGRIAVIHTLNRKTQSQTFNASASKPDKLEPPRDASTISSFQNTSQDQLGDDSSDSVASNEEITNIVNPKDYISSDNKIHPLSSSGTIYAAEASDIPTAKQLLDSQKSIASHQATVDTAEPNEDMLNQNKNRNEEDQYNNMAYNSDKSKSKASNSKSDSSFGKQAIGFNKSSFGRSTFKYINPVPLVPHVFKEKVLPDHRKQQANGIDTHTVPTGHTKLVEDNTEDDVNRQHAYDETVATDIPVGKKFLKETQSPIVLNSIGSSADVTEAGEDISDQHKNEFQKDDDKNGAYRSDKHKIQILNASNTEPDLPIREKLIVDKTNNEQDTYVNFAPLHFAETVSPNQKQDHSSAIDSNHTDLVKLTNDSTTDDVNSKLFDHTNLPISSLTSTLDETATSESPAAKKLLGNAKTPSVPESMEFAATGAGKYNVDKYVDGKEQGRSRTKGQSSNALTFEAQSSQQKDLEDIGDATTTSETIKLAENIAKEQATRKLDGSVQDSIGLPDGNFKDNFAVQQSPKESLPHLVANHLDKGITTIKDEERILKQIGRDGKFGSADHNDLLRQDSSDDDHVDGSFSINRTLKPPQNSAGEGNSKNNTPSISSDSGVIKDSMTEDGVSKDITVEPPTNKTTSTVIEKDYGSSRKNVDSTDKTYSAKYESPSKQSEKPFTEEANERFDDVASTSTTEAARYKIVIEKLPPKEANNSKDDKNVPQSSKKPFATANAKDAILQHINNVIPKLLDEGESTTAKALPNTKVSANTNPDKQQLRKHDNSDSMDENENGDSKDSNNTEPGTSYSVNPGADTAGIYKSDEYESKTEDRIYKRDIPVSLTMDAGPLNRKKSLTEVDVAGKQGLVRLTRSNDDKRYDTLSSKYIADEADHVQPGIGIIQSKVNRSSIGAASSALTNRDLAKKSKSKRKHYASETAHGRYKRVISLGENEAEAEPLNLRKPLIEAKFDDDGKWDFGRSTWSNDKRYDTLSSKYIAEEADHVQPGIGIIQSKVNSSSPDVPKSGLTNTDKAKKSNSKSEQFESETTDHKYKPSIAVSGENAAEPLSFRESLSEANFRDAEGPKRSPDDKRYDTLSSKYIAGEADHVQPGIGIIQSKVNSRSPHVPKCALTNTDKAKKSNSKSEGIETEQLSPKNEEEFPGEPYPSVARDETDIGIQANMYNNPELPPPALPILMIENEIDSETNEHDADVTKFLMKGTGKEFSEFAAKYKPPNDDIRELDIYSHERKSSHRRRQCPGCRSGKVKKVKKVQSEEETTVVSDAPSEEVTTVTEPSVVELTVNVDVVHNPEAPPPPLPLRDIIRGIQDGSFDGLVEKLEQATDELDIYHHEYVSSTSEQNPASQVPESQ